MSRILKFLQANKGKSFGDYAPPFSKFLNGIIDSALEGEIKMTFKVHEQMLNPTGAMHGGVHAAIIDEMTGLLVATLDEPTLYVSANLHVDFFGRVSIDEVITARAFLVKKGKIIINTECELTNSDGKLVSKGVCNLVNTGKLVS
jgi:uncharacterized protein (TIGR00369 family)